MAAAFRRIAVGAGAGIAVEWGTTVAGASNGRAGQTTSGDGERVVQFVSDSVAADERRTSLDGDGVLRSPWPVDWCGRRALRADGERDRKLVGQNGQ